MKPSIFTRCQNARLYASMTKDVILSTRAPLRLRPLAGINCQCPKSVNHDEQALSERCARDRRAGLNPVGGHLSKVADRPKAGIDSQARSHLASGHRHTTARYCCRSVSDSRTVADQRFCETRDETIRCRCIRYSARCMPTLSRELQ